MKLIHRVIADPSPVLITDWMLALEPIIDDRIVIAGSAAAFICSGHGQFNDIDIFANGISAIAFDILVKNIVYCGWAEEVSHNPRSRHFSHRTLPNIDLIYDTDNPFDEVGQLLETFDFTVCQAALTYDLFTGRWTKHYSMAFPFDYTRKRLVMVSPASSISTFRRINTYGQKGFFIGKMEVTKLLLHFVNNLTESDQDILEDIVAEPALVATNGVYTSAWERLAWGAPSGSDEFNG